MRLLFIAPTSNLSGNAELARIASGNLLDIVDGALDRAGLERALKEPADAVHFCGHSGKGVLQLADDLLDSADLLSMLDAQRGAKFFFLNSCDSLSLAAAIHNRLHVPCIAMDAEIDDRAAVHFAMVYYRRYRQAQNVGEAFEAAKDSLLRQFPSQAVIPTLINGDMLSATQMADCMSYMKTELGVMSAKLDGIEAMVNEIRGHQGRTLLVMLGLLLLAQLLTPVLNGLLIRLH